MTKICLVIPSLHAGGMERVMSELAGYFVEQKKCECHLVLYGIKRDVFYAIPESIIIHRPAFTFDNSRRFIHTLKTIVFLRRKIKEINPDTILSFGEYWNNFVLLSLFGLKFPVFVSDRCQPDKSLGALHDRLRKWLYPRAAGVIAQTAKAKDIYSRYFRHSNIRVIGNPIRQIGEGTEIRQNVVLSVGRLIQSKHHDALIRIFMRINMPGWKLVIVGGDALKQNNSIALAGLIRQLNAEAAVELAGNRSDVDAYYRSSSIFAFASSSEGFPNVIGEAMAAGLPVIAYDCVAGPSEMISDGENGFLIPLFDETLFESRLKMLMQEAQLREQMGVKAKKITDRFAKEAIAEEYFRFITRD